MGSLLHVNGPCGEWNLDPFLRESFEDALPHRVLNRILVDKPLYGEIKREFHPALSWVESD
jgi:hypothetical protein